MREVNNMDDLRIIDGICTYHIAEKHIAGI